MVHQPRPLRRLCAVPAAEQVIRALDGGQDLLFPAECGSEPARLGVAHDDPALP
ncbi:hypothetical protein [Streptomyces misionensis]|uniref:hypothetical protein n=1 Tax=Streptomyces misionensis TaxID=67331 RepID=UPI00164427AD|nr:hypothetical protein [Streptomyces misionensis]